MTLQELYKKFQLQINKNDTNTNVKISKGVFVLLFNEQKRKWLYDVISKNESSDYIESIEELLEADVKLGKGTETAIKADFILPENFYRRVSSYSLASREDCKNVVLYNWIVKPKDLNVLLQNDNTKPSFDYREALALINNGKLSVYKDGFVVDEAYLTYYREPVDIDMEGYTRLDGTPSTDIQTDLSDTNAEEVVNLTAAEAVRNSESVEQLQLALQRLAPK